MPSDEMRERLAELIARKLYEFEEAIITAYGRPDERARIVDDAADDLAALLSEENERLREAGADASITAADAIIAEFWHPKSRAAAKDNGDRDLLAKIIFRAFNKE